MKGPLLAISLPIPSTIPVPVERILVGKFSPVYVMRLVISHALAPNVIKLDMTSPEDINQDRIKYVISLLHIFCN
jgi:hypothetical protein